MKNIDMTLESIAITTLDGREKLEEARLIEGFGIENDRKRSDDRQISLVSNKLIVNNTTNIVGFCHKKFKENLIIMHLDVKSLDILDKISIGSAVIEITQVYKKCYDSCPKYDKSGSCQANREIAFAKVVKTGYIKKDELVIML